MSKASTTSLRWIGYVLFFIVALLIFVRISLPTDQARELLKSVLADKLKADRVEIADLGIDGLWPSGVTVEGVAIELPPIQVKTPDRGVDVEGPVRFIAADELSVSGSILGLAGGNIDVEAEGSIQGGTLGGVELVWEPDSPVRLKVAEISGVELGTEGLFQTLTGFDVIGTLNGKLDVELPLNAKRQPLLDKLVAEVELELADARVLQPIIDTVMNREPVRLAFTDTDLGTVTVKVGTDSDGGPTKASTGPGRDAKAGRRGTVISIEELSAQGGHVQLAVAPGATLTIPPGRSFKDATINAHLVVRIEDPWFEIEVKDRKDPTKTTRPNIGVRTMISMGALKRYVQDGQFGVALIGPLGSLKPRLERPRTRIGSSGSSARRVKVDHPGGEEPEAESDPRPEPPPPAAVPSSKARPLPGGRPGFQRPGEVSRPSPGGRLERPRPTIKPSQLGKPTKVEPPPPEPVESDESEEPEDPEGSEEEPVEEGDEGAVDDGELVDDPGVEGELEEGEDEH